MVGGAPHLIKDKEGRFFVPLEGSTLQMTFEEIAILLSLLGGAIFGTFHICFMLFRKNEK